MKSGCKYLQRENWCIMTKLNRLIIGHGTLWVGLTIAGNLLDDWIPDPFWHNVWLIFGVAWFWLAVAALIHFVWHDDARSTQRL